MARRDEGENPSWIFDRGATTPVSLFCENPPGGGSFAFGLRWLERYSPLRGCSALTALSKAKIPSRRTPRSFQTGSKVSRKKLAEHFLESRFPATLASWQLGI